MKNEDQIKITNQNVLPYIQWLFFCMNLLINRWSEFLNTSQVCIEGKFILIFDYSNYFSIYQGHILM